MTHEVIKEFQDKKTGDIYIVGSSFEGDAKRVNELIKLGFLKGEDKPENKDGE
ncbi:hypothetical protein [Paenibacillus rhizolycopersici]|uniref:hypothetical protein n=1 Tax=Paenibacillus rhizolycopersici TaxID=2780073 RepID=UPI003D2729F9